jgi:hypothetical protein
MANTKQLQKYNSEYDEAKKNFLYYFKPEFDRGYKLFSSYKQGLRPVKQTEK